MSARTWLVCFASLVALTESPSRGQEFTIRTTSRLVLLDVSVKNSAGASVGGLQEDNFQVFEDGKLQHITDFANRDIPVTIGILVDESGSMRPKRGEVLTAALAFISESNPQDEIFVLNFNEKVRRGLPDTVLFSDNINQLRQALWKGIPEGRTALYDALTSGLSQLNMGRKDKKTLILISDGGDNVSSSTLKDVMREVLQSVATIYTIGVFDNDDPDKNPDLLKRLAQISGGEVYFPPKIEDIVPVCKKIAKDMRSRYTIGYIPEAAGRQVRHIKVVVNAPGQGKLVAKTRTQYLMSESAEK